MSNSGDRTMLRKAESPIRKKTVVWATLLMILLWGLPDARAAYYASRNADTYHKKACRLAAKIKPSKRLVFKTPESAARAGYRPCPVCKPKRPKRPKRALKKSAAAPTAAIPATAGKTETSNALETPRPAKTSAKEKNKPQASLQKPPSPEAKIHGIKFEKSAEGKEKILFYLDGFHIPDVQSVEGESPAIQLSFPNGSFMSNKTLNAETGGRFVRRIRVEKNDPENRLMIMLDMQPRTAFQVNPFFFEEEKIYSLEITRRDPESP